MSKRMIIRFTNISQFLISFLLLIIFFFILLMFIASSEDLFLIVLAFFVLNIFFGVKKIHHRITFLFFNFTFFTFLLSQLFFQKIAGEPILENYSSQVVDEVMQLLLLSLIGLQIGLFMNELIQKKKKKLVLKKDFNAKDEFLIVFNQVTRMAFYITIPFYFLYFFDRTSFVGNSSYLEYYTSYTSSVPYIFLKLGEINPPIFSLLICTETNKKKLYIPIFLFLLGSILSLGSGQRGTFVLNMILICFGLFYLNKRNLILFGKKIYKKKYIFLMLLMIPFLVSFLYFWGNYRYDDNVDFSLSDGIEGFFVSQGGQVNFLADTVTYQDLIWSQDVPYSLSSPYNYIMHLVGENEYGTNTKENALFGNSLGVTQYYIISPESLFSGKGAGNCYISELYYDFGYWGVFIGNICLGIILCRLNLSEKHSPWINVFIIMMMKNIVYIPRASYLDWITNTFNIWNVAVIVLIYMFSKQFVLRRKR